MSRVECVDSQFVHIPLSTGWRAYHTDSALGPPSSIGTTTDMAPLHYPGGSGGKASHSLIDRMSYQAYAAGSAGLATLLCKDSTVASELSTSYNSTSALGFEVDQRHDYRGECLAMCPALGILAAATGTCVSFFSMGSRLGASPFRNLECQMPAIIRQLTSPGNVGAIKWAPLPVLACVDGKSTATGKSCPMPLYLCAYIAGGLVEVVACGRNSTISTNIPSSSSPSPSSSLPFSSTPSPQNLGSNQSLHFVRAPLATAPATAPVPSLPDVVLTLAHEDAIKVVIAPNNALTQEELAVASTSDIVVRKLDKVEEHQIGGPLVHANTKKYVSKFKRTGIQDLFLEDRGVLQDVHWLSERHLLVVTASTVAVVDVWGRMQEAIQYPHALTPEAIIEAATARQKTKKGAKRGREEDENDATDAADVALKATAESISGSRRSVLMNGVVHTSLQPDERIATFYHSSADMFRSRYLEDVFGVEEGSWIDKQGKYVIPEFAPSVNGSGVSECSIEDLPVVARPATATPTTRSWIVAVGGVSTHIRGGDSEPVAELTASPVSDLLSPGIVFLAVTLMDYATAPTPPSPTTPPLQQRKAAFECVPIGQWNGTSRSRGKGFTMDYFAPTALSLRARTIATSTPTTTEDTPLPSSSSSRCFQIVMCGTTLLSKDTSTRKLSRPLQLYASAGNTTAARQTEHKVPTRGADQRIGGYTWVLNMTPWRQKSTNGSGSGATPSTTPPYVFKGPHANILKDVRPVGQWIDVTPHAQWPAPCLGAGGSDDDNIVHTSHTADDLASVSIYKQDPCVRSIQCLSEATGINSKYASNDFFATAASGFLLGGKNVVSFVTCPCDTAPPHGGANVTAPSPASRLWGVVVESSIFTSIEVNEGSLGSMTPRSTTSEYRMLEGCGGDVATSSSTTPTPYYSPINQWYSDYDVNRFASMCSRLTYFTLDDMSWESNQRRVSKRGIGSTTNLQNDQCGKRRPLASITGLLLTPNYSSPSSSKSGGGDSVGVLGFDVASLFLFDDDVRVTGTWFSHNDRDDTDDVLPVPPLIPKGGTLPTVTSAISTVATSSSLDTHRRSQHGRTSATPPSTNTTVLLPSLLPCANAMSDLLQALKTVFFGAVSTTILHALKHQCMGVTSAVPSDLLLATSPSPSGHCTVPTHLVDGLSEANLLHFTGRVRGRHGGVVDGQVVDSSPTSLIPSSCSHIPTLCLSSTRTSLLDWSLDAAFPKVEMARAMCERLGVTPIIPTSSFDCGDAILLQLNTASESIRGFIDPCGQLRRLGEHAASYGRFQGDVSHHYKSILSELQVLQEVYLRNPSITRSGETVGLEFQQTSSSSVGCGKEAHGLNLFRKYTSLTVTTSAIDVIAPTSFPSNTTTTTTSASVPPTTVVASPHQLPVWEVVLQRALSLTYQLPTNVINSSPVIASLANRTCIIRELLLGRAVGVLDRVCVAVETNTADIARRPFRPMVTGDSCVAYIMACHNNAATSSTSSWAGSLTAPTMGSTMPGVTPSSSSTTPSIVSRWERAKKSITPATGMAYPGVSIHLSTNPSAQYPSQISVEMIQGGGKKAVYPLNAFFEPGPLKKGGVARGSWGRKCGQCAQVTPMVGVQVGGIAPSSLYEGNTICSLCRFEYGNDDPTFCLS